MSECPPVNDLNCNLYSVAYWDFLIRNPSRLEVEWLAACNCAAEELNLGLPRANPAGGQSKA